MGIWATATEDKAHDKAKKDKTAMNFLDTTTPSLGCSFCALDAIRALLDSEVVNEGRFRVNRFFGWLGEGSDSKIKRANATTAVKELKVKAVGQPYLDEMNADRLNF